MAAHSISLSLSLSLSVITRSRVPPLALRRHHHHHHHLFLLPRRLASSSSSPSRARPLGLGGRPDRPRAAPIGSAGAYLRSPRPSPHHRLRPGISPLAFSRYQSERPVPSDSISPLLLRSIHRSVGSSVWDGPTEFLSSHPTKRVLPIRSAPLITVSSPTPLANVRYGCSRRTWAVHSPNPTSSLSGSS